MSWCGPNSGASPAHPVGSTVDKVTIHTTGLGEVRTSLAARAPTGDKESELKNYVGQRVEIAGSFKKEADAQRELSPAGTSGASAAELTTANTAEFTIASIKPLGPCAGSAK